MTIFRRATGIVRDALRDDTTLPDGPMEPGWFDAAVCRNCGQARETPYCGQCGQKAAARFVWHDIGRETWERLRLFEAQSATTLARLLLSPGRVARGYVLGRRSATFHPLKLLVALVAILVLVLAANRYFSVYAVADRDGDVDRMAAREMAWANWSFSLGIVAIFAGSWAVFRRRLGYNAIEHGVLAVYCQSIILAVIILNLLPTMVWRDPAFILWHKTASQYYMNAIKIVIVGVAYRQFFLVDLRAEWPRLLAVCLVYAVVAWALLRLYAFAILWLVT